MDETVSSPEINSLSRQAIEAALNCNWVLAASLNQKIIELKPEDIPSLNRLAKALSEQGKYSEAKKIYSQVLKLDPYNPIAFKNSKRIASFKEDKAPQENGIHKLSASVFLQEPGVTKIVNLIKVAEPNKLSTLSTGMEVNIVSKSRGVVINDGNNSYLGVLPDDIAHQMLKLIEGGNKYQAIIKSVKNNGLTILIREVFRSKKFRNQPSFLEESHIVSYPSDHLTLSGDSSISGDELGASETEET